MFRWHSFPLTRALPSIPSATVGCPVLFGNFAGTTTLYDCLCSYIARLRPWTCWHDPPDLWRMTIGSPGSRAGCFCTCAGSLTAQGSAAPHVFGTSDIAFHFLLRCRHPGVRLFRGSMAGLYMPLSTLQGWPRGQPHMTQGRYGSLDLYRMTLSFTTTCRFSPALSGGIKIQ